MWRAKFWNGKVREFQAWHLTHARKKAEGIAKANGWLVKEVGKV